MKTLVLSGGGLRSLTFIGSLKAFQEEGVDFDLVGGCSGGSIVTALWAAGYSVFDMEQEVLRISKLSPWALKDVNWKGFLLLLLTWKVEYLKGFLKGEKLENLLAQLLKEKKVVNFSDLKKKCFLVSVNIDNAQEVLFTNLKSSDKRLPLIRDVQVSAAIRASASYPGIFEPKKIGQRYYVDGGVRSRYPILRAWDLSQDSVLGLNIGYPGKLEKSVLKRGIIGVLEQTFSIMLKDQFEADLEIAKLKAKEKVFTHTLRLDEFGFFELKNIPFLLKEGYRQTKNLLKNNPAIKSIFGKKEKA